MRILIKLLRDETGVSAIEYCFLAAFVSVTLMFAIATLGTNLGASFNDVAASISGSGSDDDDDDDDGDGD